MSLGPSGRVRDALTIAIAGNPNCGKSALFNAPRFTLGIQDLQSGFSFVTLAMAIFALPEAFHMVLDPKRAKRGEEGGEIKGLMITKDEAKKKN